jgi:DNA-binding NarL/FixJ family response regulator
VRGLICDDHPLVRQAFILSLQGRWPGLALAGAASFPDAWVLAEQRPDLIVADLAMPGAAPIEGVSRLRAIAPEAKLVILTGLTDAALLEEVSALGVTAMIPKILEVDTLLERLGDAVPGLRSLSAGPLPPRQREVLQLLGQGLTNKEIAIRLGIAPATVKVHVSRLIEQLGASNRTDAVSRGQRAGLI